MKIHAYLLCYNEEMIIRNVIEHYLKFCSKVFILDNLSTDRSVDIANEYDDVKVISWESGEQMNDYLHVKMKSETYKKYSRADGKYTEEIADWVISCDMDEILYSTDIVNDLSRCKELGITVPQIMGFDMVGANNISPSVALTTQYKKGLRNPRFDKRIIFNPKVDIAYNVGCHPEGIGFEYMKRAYGYQSSSEVILFLLHFKDVGERFLESAKKNVERIAQGQVKVENGKYSGIAYHYQAIVDGAISTRQANNYPTVINDDGSINTTGVIPATGEQGLNAPNVKVLEVKNEIRIDNGLSSGDVDNLFHISNVIEYMGKNYIKERHFLLALCVKYRLHGKIMKNRLEECNEYCYKKRPLLNVLAHKFRIIGSILKS